MLLTTACMHSFSTFRERLGGSGGSSRKWTAASGSGGGICVGGDSWSSGVVQAGTGEIWHFLQQCHWYLLAADGGQPQQCFCGTQWSGKCMGLPYLALSILYLLQVYAIVGCYCHNVVAVVISILFSNLLIIMYAMLCHHAVLYSTVLYYIGSPQFMQYLGTRKHGINQNCITKSWHSRIAGRWGSW